MVPLRVLLRGATWSALVPHPGGGPLTLELRGVSCWYGDVIALNDVTGTLDAPVVGLLGPNGAGKSTLLSLVAGLRSPNLGTVLVDGQPPRNNTGILRHIGIVPEPLNPPRWMTGFRFVRDLARMSGLPPSKASSEARKILRDLGLAHAMNRPIRGYSQGMKQRAKLAQAMVHKPRLLLLDEPFTGLDPPGRAMMSRAIQTIAASGTQVIFSSHVLAEVEGVTKHVSMLLFGRLVAQGSVREVREALSSVPLTIGIDTGRPKEVADAVLQMPGINSIELEEDRVTVRVKHGTDFFRAFTKAGSRLPITGFHPMDEDLESVYTMLVERRGRA